MLIRTRRAYMVAAFLVVCLASLLLPGCSAGKLSGYGGVAQASQPDAQGRYLPNYANLSGDLTNPSRLRWTKAVILFRVHGGNFITHPAAVRGLGLWNVALKQLPPEAHAPTLREATGTEAEDISVNFKPIKKGNEAGNTDPQFAAPGSPIIVHAKIDIDSSSTYWYDSLMVGIAAHEMGHALGLVSNKDAQGNVVHSPDSGDVMNERANVSALSVRDVNTVAEVYRLPAGTRIDP